MGFDEMTPYEQAAWQRAIHTVYASPRRKLIPAAIRNRGSDAASTVFDKVSGLPGAASMKEIVEKAFEGTLALTFQPAMRSARPEPMVKRYAKRHPHVRTLRDVQDLSLEQRDAMLAPKFGYTVVAAAQGGATAVAVTGAVVSTTVTGGTTAAVAIGAVAVDAVASMAIMGRTIGAVAIRYGYDVRLPDEELFAMGVLSLGVANSVGARTQALAALSRLTQQMMRRATWQQLNERLLVRTIAKVYQMLGIRLTHHKLGQTVPVIGIGLNAALSAQLTEQTFRRAQAVYRLRALSETYGIDPTEWMEASATAAPDAIGSSGEEIVDVLEVLEEVRDEVEAEGEGDREE